MNTLKLLSLLKSDQAVGPILLGVFPIDCLPAVNFKPAALVCNTDISKKSGSHWVCMYFSSKGTCNYFDSYGRNPSKKLRDYMLKYASNINISNKSVQLPFTSTCGQLCAYFLIWRVRIVLMKTILSSLEQSYTDEFVTGFINGLFKIKTVIIDEAFIVNQVSKMYKRN